MQLRLSRYAYLPDRTMGELVVDDELFYTIERPWIPSPKHLGGKNFESCIPDGEYVLGRFSSSNHHNVWRLTNPELDVYADKNPEGRWAILIHSGNYVTDVVGCIAPGLTTDHEHVWHSRKAMDRIRELIRNEDNTLLIQPKGAVNE